MWRRWKAGESLLEIGRAFGKGHGSIWAPGARSAADSSCCSSAFAANADAGRSGKTSLEELLPVRRFVRSLKGCSGLCRR